MTPATGSEPVVSDPPLHMCDLSQDPAHCPLSQDHQIYYTLAHPREEPASRQNHSNIILHEGDLC